MGAEEGGGGGLKGAGHEPAGGLDRAEEAGVVAVARRAQRGRGPEDRQRHGGRERAEEGAAGGAAAARRRRRRWG